MSCYTRHVGDWLPPDPTWLDRRALDEALREELGMADADCPEVWSAVKTNRDRLAVALKRGGLRRGTTPEPAEHRDEQDGAR